MSQDSLNRILVTGGAGMLGSQVILSVPDGIQLCGTDLLDSPGIDAVGVDLAEALQVEALFEEHGPFDGVIHTAAFTAVDEAETSEEQAFRVNALATRVLARNCVERNVPLVMVSTDFVFDGLRSEPYPVDAPTNPLCAYGRTKLAGEEVALAMAWSGARIVRTQWLYGPRGSHFPDTILRLAGERDSLKVVHDQVGSPTSTLELAPALWDVLLRGERGIYHAACEGECSWYDFAVAVLEDAGVEGVSVEPCSTAEFPKPAPRPAYSVLDCSRLTALRRRPLAPWREALRTFLGSEDR